jgi:hypothetical protein
MKLCRAFATSAAVVVFWAMSGTLAIAVTVANPSFEANTNPDPGYGSIVGWSPGAQTSAGVSTQAQPFLNQAAHDGAQAAFIQNGGRLSQLVNGLDASKAYTVTYFVSERGLPGAYTAAYVSLNGGASNTGANYIVRKTDRFRRMTSYHGPDDRNAELQINSMDGPGDDSLLIDSVSVTRAVPLLRDGGFEYPLVDGHWLTRTEPQLGLSEWTFGTSSGITRNGSAFGPPTAPEGSQAAILRSTQDISKTIPLFEAGVTYSLSFEAAGRAGGLGPTEFQVWLGDTRLTFGGNTALTPEVQTYNTYTSDPFTTSGGSFELRFDGLTTGDKTTFIDDVRFNFVAEAVPEPISLVLLSLGGMVLMGQRPN